MSASLTETATAVSFLQGLFGSAFGYVLLWTMPDKTSHWFPAASLDTDAENIAALVDRLAPDHDVYVGVSVFPEEYGPDQRGKSVQAAGIPGLWLDLDLADPVHAKTNLPATEAEALSLFTDHGLPLPTIVIHSGHGLQCWWLFREPWMFEDQADQQRAAGLAVAWQKTIRSWALARGWTVDGTADLSRVMRLPGTLNQKDPEDVRPVVIRSADASRYNSSDFQDYLSTDAVESTTRSAQDGPRIAQGGTFLLNLDAHPPFDKFEALRTNSRKFRQTWDRKRADFPSGDYSASSYDLALADLLAQAEWSDQEIVDTCLAWRRRHNELDPKKALRVDYWQRVVGLAHQAAEKVLGFAEASEAARIAWDRVAEEPAAVRSESQEEEDQDPLSSPTEEEARALSLAAVSRQMGVRVEAIYYMITDDPYYVIVFAGVQREFKLGTDKGLQDQNNFKAALNAAGFRAFDRVKEKVWNDFNRDVVKARVERNLGVTNKDKMTAWLHRYFYDKDPVVSKEEAWSSHYPYVEDGRLHLFFDPFFDWVSSLPEKLNQAQASAMLKDFGAELKRPRVGGKHGQRLRVWALPLDFQPNTGMED